MRVLSVPSGLRWAASALFVTIPLSALAVVIARNAPWWRLPYGSIVLWSAPSLFLSVVLALMLIRGSRLPERLVPLFLGFACFVCTVAAFRFHSTSLGFYTLILALVSGGYIVWLKAELSRSFYDPKIRWYQGLPQPIPGLSCEMSGASYRVGRLDREGAFVFQPEESPGGAVSEKAPYELVFRFRSREVHCTGIPIVVLDRVAKNSGVGVQFKGMTPDMNKKLGDFVETIHGEGYAQD